MVLIGFCCLKCHKSDENEWIINQAVEQRAVKYYQEEIKISLQAHQKALIGITMEKGIDTSCVSIYWISHYSLLEDIMKDYTPLYVNMSDSLAIVVFEHLNPILDYKRNDLAYDRTLFQYVEDDRPNDYQYPIRDIYPIMLKMIDTTVVKEEVVGFPETVLGKSFEKQHPIPLPEQELK